MAFWSSLEPVTGLVIQIAATDRGLCRLSLLSEDSRFLAELSRQFPKNEWRRDDAHPVLRQATQQLKAYFRGKLQRFDLRLDLHGTRFQQKVWRALRSIPYGQTRSYRDVACKIGSPKAVRAVGGATGRNPVAIVIPCHRVIAADGSLGGFGCGLPTKRLLLGVEGAWALGHTACLGKKLPAATDT